MIIHGKGRKFKNRRVAVFNTSEELVLVRFKKLVEAEKRANRIEVFEFTITKEAAHLLGVLLFENFTNDLFPSDGRTWR